MVFLMYAFEWDVAKNRINIAKHGVSFDEACLAFKDLFRVIKRDKDHEVGEHRFFCFGKVDGKIMTVRFSYREGRIRIYGAGYWRKGKKHYEEKNNLH